MKKLLAFIASAAFTLSGAYAMDFIGPAGVVSGISSSTATSIAETVLSASLDSVSTDTAADKQYVLDNAGGGSSGPITTPTFATITGYTSTVPVGASVIILATNDPMASIVFDAEYDSISGYTNAFVDLTIVCGSTNSIEWNTDQVDGSWAFLNLSVTDPNYVFATKRGTNKWSLMRDLP